MVKSQLTKQQINVLSFINSELLLYKSFYFTGGTCLSEYYLHHRYSEDLDFFSEQEFNPMDVTALFKSKKNRLGYKEIDFQQSFNRNIYHLIFSSDYSLKVEFTYFPFGRIDDSLKKDNLSVDSLKDIAVNKVFTIMQKPRGRDFYDLYFILRHETEWSFKELLKLARMKFDFHIDYLQFGANLMEVTKLKDDPLLIHKVDNKEVEKFILGEAKKFGKDIVK